MLALALLVVLLWLGRTRPLVAAVLAGVIFAGLYFSYSQSSLVVLFATVLVASLLLADRLRRNIVIGVAVAMVVAGSAVASLRLQSTASAGRRVGGRGSYR